VSGRCLTRNEPYHGDNELHSMKW